MAEPVDTLALLIAHLRAQGDLVDLVADRIAGKHRFAEADAPSTAPRGWGNEAAKALTLRYAGRDGEDLISCPDAAQARRRVEARAWGESQAEAARVWGELERVVQAHTRTLVALPDGREALLFVLAVADGPEGELDPETGFDILRGTLRVHAQAIA